MQPLLLHLRYMSCMYATIDCDECHMDFICYLHPGWKPLIRPAEATRSWMDEAPEAFAYRCLPLNIANQHGWEILCPCTFDACWNGGKATEDVAIRLPREVDQDTAPVSLFGQGVLTFHIMGLFRTPPGWNLWVSGSPNRPKEGIYPLTGVIETDWSPYTFTMNWRFVRRNHWVRFEREEPIAFIFPLQRTALERVQAKFVPLETNPPLLEAFTAWSRSRTDFHALVSKDPPPSGSARWQKRYYRGIDMDDRLGTPDHRTKLRIAPFVPGEPSEAEPLTIDTDAESVTAVLRGFAEGVRAGESPGRLAGRLAPLGLSEEVLHRICENVYAAAG
jgi:Family of unknown function (DUF6065)